MSIKRKIDFIDQNQDNLINVLIEFLKIKSISTDQQFIKPCREAANWLVDYLVKLGFQAEAYKTKGHPIVFASLGEGDPHLLFYGHYDVQPVDPLEEWNSDPFDPKINSGLNEGQINARGASDDKGQLMTFINACTAFIKIDGKLPCKITILIEGEEETGSQSLDAFIETNKENLRADYALICDTGMWDNKTPAISTMLRGMLGEEIKVTGPAKDLHSGIYGGPAINPIRELTRSISSLHDEHSKITINNFYKGVHELPKRVKKQWDALNFSSNKFLQSVGLKNSVGEKGYTVLEQIWARPTCEINGIWGGYTGDGFKTVIPSAAFAKVSFRLVGDQEPEKIRIEFRKHIKAHLHKDCKVSFTPKDGSKAINVPLNSPIIMAAEKGLFDEWGTKPVFAGCGGSIPVVGTLKRILDLDTLLVGFSLDDDQIHSTNEKYNVQSYQKGAKSWIRIIDSIVNQI